MLWLLLPIGLASLAIRIEGATFLFGAAALDAFLHQGSALPIGLVPLAVRIESATFLFGAAALDAFLHQGSALPIGLVPLHSHFHCATQLTGVLYCCEADICISISVFNCNTHRSKASHCVRIKAEDMDNKKSKGHEGL